MQTHWRLSNSGKLLLFCNGKWAAAERRRTQIAAYAELDLLKWIRSSMAWSQGRRGGSGGRECRGDRRAPSRNGLASSRKSTAEEVYSELRLAEVVGRREAAGEIDLGSPMTRATTF